MSGEPEIRKWVEDNLDLSRFGNVEDAYEEIKEKGDWRTDLDDILLDQKPKFLKWLESQITLSDDKLFDAIPKEFIKIRAFSYIRNGKVVNVPSHQRRKRK